MAWIELHQSLRDHRKVLQAADELGVHPAHVVGLLSLLWLWAIDNAESGDLSRVTSRTIARAAQWEGDADTFVTAIINAGFIDPDTNSLHDWLQYSGKLLERREQKRAQNRERQQRFREKSAQQSDADITKKSRARNALISDSTVPNSTVPNSTVPIGDITPHTPHVDEDTQAKKSMQEQRFTEFWTAYPKKVGKEAARKSWMRIKLTAEMHAKIMSAVSAAKNSAQWKRENGRFVPNPATWLNQGRWDDELEGVIRRDAGVDRQHTRPREGSFSLSGFKPADKD